MNNIISNTTNSITKMFGRIAPGMCRLSMNGIAIKTSNGYKTYDVNTGSLVNCADFVFDIGEDMFFCIPCNDLKKGDIILSNGKPVCVINVVDNRIEAFRYEDSSIISIVPENMVFFGNTYFYTKIVSLFGDMSKGVDANSIFPYMIMSEMFKGNNGTSSGMAQYLPLMMIMGGKMDFSNMFSNLFSGFNFGNKNEDTDHEGKDSPSN